jgi:dUTP pyrophosphatase
MLEVKFKLNHPNAKVPEYAHETDACFDLYGADINYTDKYIEYNTGLNILIPEDYVGLLFPRSSVTNKTLILKNSVGVIDHGYTGDITVRYYVTPHDYNNYPIIDKDKNIYEIGDRVGQLLIIQRPKIKLIQVDYFEKTVRGSNVYGSTVN